MEEDKLYNDLRKFWRKLQRRVQKLIDTYYEDELFFLHVNKVYTIVEEMKPEYRAILLKHGLTQFYNARETTTTLYTIQQKKVSTKARLYEPQIIREADVGLFRTNPQIEDSLRYNTFQASDTTLARVSNNITNNLADSYHEGLGIRDAGRKITKEFSRLKGWESRRIARTEINSAQNEGAFSAYDELGVEYHMWWTGQDNRVRDSHAPLHGHIVAVGNTFSNGLLYPGDKSGRIKEWINCRCTSIPFIIPLGKMAPPGLTEFTEDQLVDIPGYMPISIEDALNGEYPLDYYQTDGVFHQYKNQGINTQLFSEEYGIPLDHSLSKAQFAVPTEDLSEFGITEKGLKVIHGFQKRRFNADREYGFAFNEKTGKILTDEFMGAENDIVMLSPKKQHATIHFHTEDGLSPLSHQDIGNSLGIRKEKLSIAMSKKETWLMQKKDPQKVFTSKEINKITKDIEKFEMAQKKKMRAEYDRKQHKIKKIKDPQERKLVQERFDEYLNNEFLDKHNQELGNRILDYFDNHKDLRVRRIMNTPTKRGSIESLHNLKVNKKIYNMYGTLKHSTPINSKVKDIDKYALTEAQKINALKTNKYIKDVKNFNNLKFRNPAFYNSQFDINEGNIPKLENKKVKWQIENFSEFTEDSEFENLELYDEMGNSLIGIIVGGENYVDMDSAELREHVKNGAKIAIHNHPKKFNNVHSHDDIIIQLESGLEINIVDSHTKRFILVDEGLSLNERNRLIRKIKKDKKLFYRAVFRLAQPEIDNINPRLPYHIRERLKDEIYNKKAKLLMPKYEKHLMKILDSTSEYNMYVREIRRF